METLRLIRPTKDTHLFRKNQKCWILFGSGSGGICVKAKYRGRGRYIEAWLQYPSQCDPDSIKEIEVSDSFYKFISGGA